jgi:hypothetical protein
MNSNPMAVILAREILKRSGSHTTSYVVYAYLGKMVIISTRACDQDVAGASVNGTYQNYKKHFLVAIHLANFYSAFNWVYSWCSSKCLSRGTNLKIETGLGYMKIT